MTTRFAIRTQGQSYSVTPGPEVVEVQLDGGLAKKRRDILNAATRVSVGWMMSSTEFDYFMAFYKTTTKSGSLPFTIDLVIDSHATAIYTATFVAGSCKWQAAGGGIFSVTADLDVEAIARDATADAALVAAFNTAHGL